MVAKAPRVVKSEHATVHIWEKYATMTFTGEYAEKFFSDRVESHKQIEAIVSGDAMSPILPAPKTCDSNPSNKVIIYNTCLSLVEASKAKRVKASSCMSIIDRLIKSLKLMHEQEIFAPGY